MSIAVYHSWLYDSREAWQKSIADSRWSYDMPLSRFMAIYAEHRGTPCGVSISQPTPILAAAAPLPPLPSVASAPAPKAATAAPAGGAGQILSQNEIDGLLNQLAK